MLLLKRCPKMGCYVKLYLCTLGSFRTVIFLTWNTPTVCLSIFRGNNEDCWMKMSYYWQYVWTPSITCWSLQNGDDGWMWHCVLVLVLDGVCYRLSVGGLRRPSRGCRLVTGSRPWLIQTPPGWPDGAFRLPKNKSRTTFQWRQNNDNGDENSPKWKFCQLLLTPIRLSFIFRTQINKIILVVW